MEKNRNLKIGALIVLLVIWSIWGGVNSRNAKTYKLELEAAHQEIAALQAETKPAAPVVEVDKVGSSLTKEALEQLKQENEKLHSELKKMHHAVKQMQKAREELVALRKASQRHAAVITQKEALIGKLEEALKAESEKDSSTETMVEQLNQKLTACATALAETRDKQAQQASQVTELKQQLAVAQENLAANEEQSDACGDSGRERLSRLAIDYETAQAQIIGLEKIVEEKNAALAETSRELDRIKINMDVLLGKISDQQDILQEQEQENLELVKELTLKNKKLADLEDQLNQTPLQE
ncbi:hypothetical protein [Desulfogranum japonicum]|uniref:hypothetical protein n=1 Tax=Desulfogranum japonicum TaxID=231447 RepID=UPI000426632F|nr:hypothetical protein [Desulfogranum japonicum]